MDIQSLGGSSVTPVRNDPTTTGPPPTLSLDGILGTIAPMLGMTVSSMQAAISGGQSINSLITQTGASRSAIVSAVENQVQQTQETNGQPPIAQTTLDRMVSRAFERHGSGHRHPVEPPPATGGTTDPTEVTPTTDASALASTTGSAAGSSSTDLASLVASLQTPFTNAGTDADGDGSSPGVDILA